MPDRITVLSFLSFGILALVIALIVISLATRSTSRKKLAIGIGIALFILFSMMVLLNLKDEDGSHIIGYIGGDIFFCPWSNKSIVASGAGRMLNS